MEVSGNEARTPPISENFFPSSEIPTTTMAVISILINKYIFTPIAVHNFGTQKARWPLILNFLSLHQ